PQPGSRAQSARSGLAAALSRRLFLARSLWAGGGLAAGATLSAPTARRAWAQAAEPDAARSPGGAGGYGPPAPALDQRGERVLGLPEGFRYVPFSRSGEPLDGGAQVPARPHGMASFARPDGTIRLIRNHELPGRADAHAPGVALPAELHYDAKAR